MSDITDKIKLVFISDNLFNFFSIDNHDEIIFIENRTNYDSNLKS